jgi:hypothetical protein
VSWLLVVLGLGIAVAAVVHRLFLGGDSTAYAALYAVVGLAVAAVGLVLRRRR